MPNSQLSTLQPQDPQQSWWFLDKKIIEQFKSAYGGSVQPHNNGFQLANTEQYEMYQKR